MRPAAPLTPLAILILALLPCRLAAESEGVTAVLGPVLFVSHFDDGDLTGWQFDRPEVWSISNGRLLGHLPDAKQKVSFAFLGSEDWTDYAVDVDVVGLRGVDKGVVVRAVNGRGIGVDLRGIGYHDVVMYRGRMPVARATALNAAGLSHHLRVEARGLRYRVFVDGELKIDHRDSAKEYWHGRVALAAYTGGDGSCAVLYDNVRVTRLD
jgi:hypothetical protein